MEGLSHGQSRQRSESIVLVGSKLPNTRGKQQKLDTRWVCYIGLSIIRTRMVVLKLECAWESLRERVKGRVWFQRGPGSCRLSKSAGTVMWAFWGTFENTLFLRNLCSASSPETLGYL